MDKCSQTPIKIAELNISNSLRSVFDKFSRPLTLRDMSSRIIYSNEAAADFLLVKSVKDLNGKHDTEIDCPLFNDEAELVEFDKQYKQTWQLEESYSTLEIHPNAVDRPYIYRRIPFYNDNMQCVGMYGYVEDLNVYSLNDYVKGHMPGSLLINKPDDFFTERECEIMFYRLQGMKAKDAAARLNLALTTFNNYMQRLYYKTGATNLDEFQEFCTKLNYNRYLPKRFLTNEAINFSSSII